MTVPISNLVTNVVIILGLFSKFGESMRFDLTSGHTKCVSEDINHNGMTVGKYSVVNPNEGYPLPDTHKLTVKVCDWIFNALQVLIFSEVNVKTFALFGMNALLWVEKLNPVTFKLEYDFSNNLKSRVLGWQKWSLSPNGCVFVCENFVFGVNNVELSILVSVCMFKSFWYFVSFW